LPEVNRVLREIFPSISVVIPTYNSERILPQCLESIIRQNYPREKIEVIIVDGGSKDKTLEIARSFGAKIIHERTGRPESATAIGYNHATNDLILNMPSDNILPDNRWLRRMIEPFMKFRSIDRSKYRKIIAVQPLRYTYRKDLSMLDRYFAIFGMNDPLAFYLKKRDRLSWMEDQWILKGNAKDTGNFFIVKFDTENCPTLGANGYIVRREIIQKVSKDTSRFFHIDSNIDLIKMGYNTYGIVKTSIIHQTGENFFNFFVKRVKYMKIYFGDRIRRRYHLFDSHKKEDRKNLLKFILFSLTFIKTTYDSLEGFRKTRDMASLIHPIICFITVFLYGITTIALIVRDRLL